jgi:hypothetical protein
MNIQILFLPDNFEIKQFSSEKYLLNKMNCELMLTYDTPAYMFNVYKNQPSWHRK